MLLLCRNSITECSFCNPHFPIAMAVPHPYKSCQNTAADNLRARPVNCFHCFSLSFPSTRFRSPWASAVGIAKRSGQVPLRLLLPLTSGCRPEAISHSRRRGPSARTHSITATCPRSPHRPALGGGEGGGSAAPCPTERRAPASRRLNEAAFRAQRAALHSPRGTAGKAPSGAGGCKLDAKIKPPGTR